MATVSDGTQDRLPVVDRDDGGITLRSKSGSFEPLYMGDGTRVVSFVNGWTPTNLFFGFGNFKILTFEGPSSASASWIISDTNARLGDSVSQLSDSEQHSLASAAHEIYISLCNTVLFDRYPALDSDLQQLMRISPSIRLELFHRLKDALPGRSRTTLVSELEDISRLPFIEESFKSPFFNIITSFSPSGAVSWPALGADNRIEVQGSLILDDFRFCYRLFDVSTETAYFVVSSDHLATTLGIYVPSMALLVTDGDWSRHLIDVYFPEGVSHRIVEHFLIWGEALCGYMKKRGKRAANIMRTSDGVHMGHQLWNELSGIESYYAKSAASIEPLWIVPGKDQSIELWGNIEDIFNESKMDVLRGLDGIDLITTHIYNNNLCGVRITHNFVSEKLRKAILNNFDRRIGASEQLEKLGLTNSGNASVSRQRSLNIVFGLRVENRTIIDYKNFCKLFVQYVARTWPGSNIIVDGHNVVSNGDNNNGALIPSHGERMLNRSSIFFEEEIAAEMSASAESLPVNIISLIGSEIGRSLKICAASDLFFSVWGAGLAKYRWICNLPGFIVTSRVNLRFRDDIHIYDDPRYMESPTAVRFNNPESVEDDYSSDQLISVGGGSKFYASFRVKEVDLFEEFREFVDANLAVHEAC